MRITHISVSRLPGIDQPFEIDKISPGINIILGPNGSGKSSICRVVRQSLWPDHSPSKTRVRITWDEQGAVFTSHLDSGLSWQRDGNETTAPEVPPSHLARCYTVTLRDLLEDKNPADRKLAEEIRISMAGGYNLPAVKQLFLLKKTHGRSESRTMEKAERVMERLQIDRRALSEDEDKLSTLQEELTVARSATRECYLLSIVLELQDKRKNLLSIQAAVKEFPPGMDELQGNERRRIQELESELDELKRIVCDKNRELKDAERELRENRLPEGEIAEDMIRLEEDRVRCLEELARERELHEKELYQAEEMAKVAGTSLGITTDNPGDIDFELPLEDVEKWVKKAIRLKERRNEIKTRLEHLAPSPRFNREDVDRIRRGIDILGDWLSSPGGLNTVPMFSLRLLTAIVLIPAGGILAVLWNPWFIILGGLGLGVLLMSYLTEKLQSKHQTYLQNRFKELEINPPISWRKAEVRSRLGEIREELRRGEDSLAENMIKERLEGELRAMEEESRTIEKQRLLICGDVGLDPGATELSIIDFIDRLLAYRKFFQSASLARSSVEVDRERFAREFKKIQDFFARKSGEIPQDELECRHLLISLKEKNMKLLNARLKIEATKRELDKRESEIEKKEVQIKDIYQSAGLVSHPKPVADKILDDMLERLDEYREKIREIERIKSAIADGEAQLEDRSELLKLDRSETESRLESARELEKKRDDLVALIQRIRDRIEAAVEGDAMEKALADIEAAAFQLQDRYTEALSAQAGLLLLEKAEEEYDELTRPAVLDKAARWFSAFTGSRYELMVSGEPGAAAFRARDTGSGQGLDLGELSDGTRVQLLLATRLAFATQTEPGGVLPVFLDEALTTSDLSRFRSIAESLIVFAGEGRQVFYLTSNPSDAEYFSAICREIDYPAPNLIDLGYIRKLAVAEKNLKLLSPEIPDNIPEPKEMSSADYGRLINVPVFNPYLPASSCHLFYILDDDLKLLYTLMRDVGIFTVGQWDSFTRLNPNPPGISRREKDRIDALIRILYLFLEKWAIGRGKSIDREILTASGAVSERYIDGFSELAQELNGDSGLFLEHLEAGNDPRVTRYPTRKKTMLRVYLKENEFLDLRERLTMEEIVAVITRRPEVLSCLPMKDIRYRVSGFWRRANIQG